MLFVIKNDQQRCLGNSCIGIWSNSGDPDQTDPRDKYCYCYHVICIMSCVERKTVLGVSEQVRHKHAVQP